MKGEEPLLLMLLHNAIELLSLPISRLQDDLVQQALGLTSQVLRRELSRLQFATWLPVLLVTSVSTDGKLNRPKLKPGHLSPRQATYLQSVPLRGDRVQLTEKPTF